MSFLSHEEYFAGVSLDARRLLQAVQESVETSVPGASRCIGYNMPAFKLECVFFYFAAFKKHIGIYPPVTQDIGLIRQLAPYRGGREIFPFLTANRFPSS